MNFKDFELPEHSMFLRYRPILKELIILNFESSLMYKYLLKKTVN